jgi:hypothetical protein
MGDQTSTALENSTADTPDIDDILHEREELERNRIYLTFFPSEKSGFARYSCSENEIQCGTQV